MRSRRATRREAAVVLRSCVRRSRESQEAELRARKATWPLEYTQTVARRVEIQLPDDLVSKVEQAASEQGISVEQLVRVSVEEKIQRDSQFEAAVDKVLEKNAELYRRLS